MISSFLVILLEILILILPCMYVRQKAENNGKRGWIAIVYTVASWFGFKYMGLFIAASIPASVTLAYVIMYGFAVIGVVIAIIISRKRSI